MISSWRPTHLQNELTKKNKLNALWLNHLPTKANYSNHFSNWVFQVFPTISKEKNWFQKTNKVACVRNLTICQVFKVLFSKKKKSNSKFLPSSPLFCFSLPLKLCSRGFICILKKQRKIGFLFVCWWKILRMVKSAGSCFCFGKDDFSNKQTKKAPERLKAFQNSFFCLKKNTWAP